MALARISEYGGYAHMNGISRAPAEPALAIQAVTFTTSTQSSAFGSNTRLVRVAVDGKAHYLVGTDPTATTDHMLIHANTTIEFAVQPGHKIALVVAA